MPLRDDAFNINQHILCRCKFVGHKTNYPLLFFGIFFLVLWFCFFFFSSVTCEQIVNNNVFSMRRCVYWRNIIWQMNSNSWSSYFSRNPVWVDTFFNFALTRKFFLACWESCWIIVMIWVAMYYDEPCSYSCNLSTLYYVRVQNGGLNSIQGIVCVCVSPLDASPPIFYSVSDTRFFFGSPRAPAGICNYMHILF